MTTLGATSSATNILTAAEVATADSGVASAAAADATTKANAAQAAAIAAAPKAANVPAVATGGLVLLSDVITALGALQASHNSLLAKLKAAGLMVAD